MTAFVLWIGATMTAAGSPPEAAAWWDGQVAASLDRAPARKTEWVRLLETCPREHRPGLAYLMRYLPLRDLETLRPAALADNLALAYQARAEVPWGPGLPEDVFLDAVLPHASVTEPRDSMRTEFHARYLPLVKGCKTPGEAALAINKKLFADYKVGYNTRRLRTDQSSKESIAQGMATCTGLSIMLVEACRSVGVPARLAGIASWPGRGGNHTWVEVWDNGWHFVGAAEPDDKGLDHAWFVGDASKAIKGTSKNAIYAVTYRSTGDFFPLVWAPSAKMPGEDVTDRYSHGKSKAPAPRRLMVEVRRGGDRVEADVTTLDRKTGASRPVGSSLGPQADINRHLTCEAPPGGSLFVVARYQGRAAVLAATVADAGDTVVRVDLDRPIPDDTRAELGRMLADRFGADATKKAAAGKLLAEIPWDESLRDLAWSAYKASPAHDSLRREFEAKTVATKDRKSPYLWRHVGQKPADGWAPGYRDARRRQRAGSRQRPAMASDVQAVQGSSRGRRLCLSLAARSQRHVERFLRRRDLPARRAIDTSVRSPGRRQPRQGLYLGRLARRLRCLRDRPQDARPVRGHPRLRLGPHSGRDAGRELARRSLHLHGRRARHRLRPRRTLPGV